MQIETERLLLRAPEARDFDRYWQMLTDPEAKRYTGGVTRMGYDERRALFLEDCAVPFGPEGAELAVLDRNDGRYLGYCGFRRSEELDAPEFLYGYCRDCWGRGIATEAARAVLDWLFAAYPHDEYAATVVPANLASAAVLRRLGFVKSGSLTDAGEPLDCYRLTRDAYEAGA